MTKPSFTPTLFCCLIIALGFGCSAGSDAFPSESCPSALANERGVGLICSSHADCEGLEANFCPAAEDSRDWDFCTRPCSIFLPDGDKLACGEGAQCTDHGWGPALCTPVECSAELAITPIYPEASIPCAITEAVNDLGVGKPCEVHEDCTGQPAGKCPMDIHAGLPTWCSMLCDGHQDCGENAFCWQRPAVDGGLVGSCAPIDCRIYPSLNSECTPDMVNTTGLGLSCENNKNCENLSATQCLSIDGALNVAICSQSCIHDDDCGANAFCMTGLDSAEGTCTPILCIN